MTSSENVISATIRGDASSAVAAMKEAASATGSASAQMRSDLAGLGHGASEASGPLGFLSGALREYRGEVSQERRMSMVLARDIAEMGIASKSAAGEVTKLASAFTIGGGIGVAIEGVKMLVAAFNEMAGESKHATEEAIKGIDDLDKKVKDYLATLAGESTAEKMRRQALEPLQKQEIAQKNDLIAATDALAVQQAKVDDLGKKKMLGIEDVAQLRVLEGQVEEKRKLLDLTEQEIKARGGIAGEGVAAEAAKNDKEARAQAALDAAKWRAAEIAEWKKHYDAITEALAKSLKEQDELQQQDALELAKIRAAEVNDAKKRYDEVTASTLKSLQEQEAAEKKSLAERTKTVKSFVDGFEHAAQRAVHSIIEGTKSVGDAMVEMLKGFAEAVIDGFLKMAAQAVVSAIVGKQAAALESTASTAGHTAAAIAGAAESQAFIPFAGPELAAAAAAETSAMLTGFTAPLLAIASAAGGMAVPHDMLAFIHKDERVLPAKYSEGLDNLVLGAGGGGGGDVHVHIHAVAVDGPSVDRLVRSYEFKKSMRDVVRRGD